MAQGLFGYSTQQKIVQPERVNVQVAKRPSFDAAKGIQSLLASADGYYAGKVREKNQVDSEQATLDAEQDKIAYYQETREMGDELTVAYSQHSKSIVDANGDISALSAANEELSYAVEQVRFGRSEKAWASLDGQVNGYLRNANDKLNIATHDYNSKSMKESISSSMPIFLQQSPADQKEAYTSAMEAAKQLGVSPREVSDQFATSVLGYGISTMDLEKIVNTLDYSQLGNLEKSLTRLGEFDTRLNDKGILTQSLNKVSIIRDKLDSALRSTVNKAIQVQDRGTFSTYLEKGVKVGAISEVDAQLLKRQFEIKNLSGSHNTKKVAEKVIEESLGITNVSTQPVALQPKLKKIVKDTLIESLNGDLSLIDPKLLKFNAFNNQELYAPIYRKAVGDTLNNTVALLSQPVGKTPELEAQRQANLTALVDRIGGLESVGFGHLEPKQILEMALIREAFLTPNIKDIQGAMSSLKSTYGIKLIPSTSKEMTEMREKVPADSYEEARMRVSSLVGTGEYTLEEARKVVQESYQFEEVGDVQVSNRVLNAFGNNEHLDNFLDVLVEAEDLPEDFKDSLQSLYDGEGVKLTRTGWGIELTNEDGGRIDLPLSSQNFLDISTAMREKAESTEGQSAIKMAMSKAIEPLAVEVSKKFEVASKGLSLLWEGLSYPAGRIASKIDALSMTASDSQESYNKFLLSIMSDDKAVSSKALAEFHRDIIQDTAKYDKFLKDSKIEIDAELTKKVYDFVLAISYARESDNPEESLISLPDGGVNGMYLDYINKKLQEKLETNQ